MARAGWTTALAKRLHRPDPRARVIVEADVVTQAAVKQRKDQWEQYDVNPGVTVLDDGRMILAPTTTTVLENSVGTTNKTDLDRAFGPIVVAGVEWGGSETRDFTIEEISFRLDPDTGGTGSTVDVWALQTFRVDVERGPLDGSDLVPLHQPIEVAAGASAGDVTFSYPAGRELRPKAFGPPTIDGGLLFSGNDPVTIFMVWALDENGDLVTSNVAWVMDGSTSSKVTSGNALSGFTMSRTTGIIAEDAPSRWSITTANALPRMSVVKQSYTSETVTYTNNGLDFSSAPSGDVRFSFEDETPDDTSVTYEVNDGSGWVTVNSGEYASADLAISIVAAYDFRVTLDPGSPADKSPAVVSARAEEVAVIDFDGLAQVQTTGWQTDPTNLKGSICEATITALQDGSKDYRDKATMLAANHAVRDIAFRVTVGYKNAAGRVRGLHIDTFDVDDYTGEGAAMRFVCVGRNGRLSNVKLPPFDTTDNSRERIDYENASLTAVYDDLLGTQLAMDERFRGTDVVDSTQVTKRITDSTAIDEIDAVAYLAGGSIITSQGRLKFVPMHQEDGGRIRAMFRNEDITPTGIGPGLRARVPEVDVLWDYDFDAEKYTKEAIHKSADALLYFDPWRVDGEPETVSDSVTQWIDTQALAETVGERIVETRGTGTILWSFGTTYAYPYLEPGDMVAIQTDRFAARDPQNSGRALRGKLWAIGRIVRVGNVAGSEFTVWIQRYSDIRGGTTVVERRGFFSPEISGLQPVARSATSITYSPTWGEGTKQLWIWTNTVAATAAPVWPGNGVGDLTILLTEGPFTIQRPASGFITYVQVEARGSDPDDVGQIWRFEVYSTLQGALVVQLISLTFTEATDYSTADILLKALDQDEAGGTLEIWTNPGSLDNPDPTGAADDTVAVADGETIGATGSGADVTTSALDDVRVPEGSAPAKTIYARLTASDGRSTGIVAWNTIKLPRQLGNDGKLVDGSVVAAQLIAGAQTFKDDIDFSATDFDTVEWTSGTITRADGNTYSISAGNTGNMTLPTYIYLDTASSTTVLQTSVTASDAVGDSVLFLAFAQPAASATQKAFFIAAFGALGVNEAQLSDDAISSIKIQTDAITTTKITNNAVTTPKIVAGAITTAKLDALAVTADKIAANAITATKIAAGVIEANHIAANTITTAKLNVADISALEGTFTGVLSSTDFNTTNARFRNGSGGGRIEVGEGSSGGQTLTIVPGTITYSNALAGTYGRIAAVDETGTGNNNLVLSGPNSAETGYTESIRLRKNGQVEMANLPTSNPGGSGRLWNNGGVVNIT